MMHLFVKKRLHKYCVCTENEAPVGEVRESARRGCDLSLFDAAGKPVGRVRKDGETLFIENTCAGTFSCPLRYRTDAAGRRVQKALVRPPMADNVEAETALGELFIRQTPAREFLLFLNGQRVGRVEHMMGLHPEIDFSQEALPRGGSLVLFAMCVLLYRDDDVEIV